MILKMLIKNDFVFKFYHTFDGISAYKVGENDENFEKSFNLKCFEIVEYYYILSFYHNLFILLYMADDLIIILVIEFHCI